jgi:nucleolar complex protein 3
VKSRSHSIHSEVLKVLLALRIKDINLEQEKKDEMKQKKFMKHKQKLMTMSKNERKVICLYCLCNLMSVLGLYSTE